MGHDLDSALLRSFVATARVGAISRAAAALNRTQPAVSQHLKRLEEQLGTKLFLRTSAGVSLTPNGERAVLIAARILDLIDGLGASTNSGPGRTKMRIGLPEEFVGEKTLQALTDLALIHSSAVLEFVTCPCAEFASSESGRRFDFWVSDPRLHPDLTPLHEKAVELDWMAVRTEAFVGATIPILLWKQPCAWRNAVVQALEEASVAWRCGYEASQVAALQTAAREGLGVMIAPKGLRIPGLVSYRSPVLPAAPSVSMALYGRSDMAHVSAGIWRVVTRNL